MGGTFLGGSEFNGALGAVKKPIFRVPKISLKLNPPQHCAVSYYVTSLCRCFASKMNVI